ncbi:hypothetical protein [Nocardia caishijiensis]|uniref:Secreted protein n=1 Tax=Nocardia caishijiensis TaxID=184756 RepID=A0ABQ6YFB9_9NOCA|nr:hypothetical protein [Nocardia caishijiensis]KAF0836675.1 hypothetical protein FNL39_11383 [Nocardia caishijiensis]
MSTHSPHRTVIRVAVIGALVATPLGGVATQASAAEIPTHSVEFVDRDGHHDNGLHLGHHPLRKLLHHLLPHGAFGSVD